jgi:hypothetical protein
VLEELEMMLQLLAIGHSLSEAKYPAVCFYYSAGHYEINSYKCSIYSVRKCALCETKMSVHLSLTLFVGYDRQF